MVDYKWSGDKLVICRKAEVMLEAGAEEGTAGGSTGPENTKCPPQGQSQICFALLHQKLVMRFVKDKTEPRRCCTVKDRCLLEHIKLVQNLRYAAKADTEMTK